MEEVNKTEQEIQDIQNKLKDILDLNEIEELIKSNEKIFDVDGVTYRVRKPSFKQKQEAYKRRVEKFSEFIKNDKYMLEKDLKEIYLKRGIDIDALTKEIELKMKKRDDLMLVLGGAIKEKESVANLEKYKNEIEEINTEIQILSIRKTGYLEFSIEYQIMIDTYSFLSFLIAEKLIKGKDLGEGKKEEDKYVKVWNTLEEFENDNENLLNKISYYTTMMGGTLEL